MGEAFIADLYADWLAHGFATIEKVRTTRPADYLKVIASILPKDVNMNVSPFEHMTDAELDALIARLLAERDDGAEREGPPSREQIAFGPSPNTDSFDLNASFTLGSASNGINPPPSR